MHIKRLAHVCIASLDLAATERFYCSGLGFKKHFDFIRQGQVIGFYLRHADGSFIEAFLRDEVNSEAKAPISHMCFEVADMDALRAHLLGLGYKIGEKKVGGDQSWQTWVNDPSGVRIEFHQYTPDSAQFTGKNCILS